VSMPSNNKHTMPSWEEYYMGIAVAVREKANCLKRRVGAVIVLNNRIIATGYNGTPEGIRNCLEGGCRRCAHPEQFQPGTGYDLCICVHAEQNALLSAARFGIAVEGADMYSTMRPCFGCTKELLQAKINTVYYLHDWQHPDEKMHEEYRLIQSKFPGGIRQVKMDDAKVHWAEGRV